MGARLGGAPARLAVDAARAAAFTKGPTKTSPRRRSASPSSSAPWHADDGDEHCHGDARYDDDADDRSDDQDGSCNARRVARTTRYADGGPRDGAWPV